MNKKKHSKGQALVETSLTLGTFVLVVIFMVWLGLYGACYITARFAANEGARAGSAAGVDSTVASAATVNALQTTFPLSGYGITTASIPAAQLFVCPYPANPPAQAQIWVCVQQTANPCTIKVAVAGWVNVGIPPPFSPLIPFTSADVEYHQSTLSQTGGADPHTCNTT